LQAVVVVTEGLVHTQLVEQVVVVKVLEVLRLLQLIQAQSILVVVEVVVTNLAHFQALVVLEL
jgi:hypothetical protein